MSPDAILGALVTLALAGISGIVWLVRLEGRINTESQLRESQIDNALAIQKGAADRQSTFENRIYQELREIKEILRDKADRS